MEKEFRYTGGPAKSGYAGVMLKNPSKLTEQVYPALTFTELQPPLGGSRQSPGQSPTSYAEPYNKPLYIQKG